MAAKKKTGADGNAPKRKNTKKPSPKSAAKAPQKKQGGLSTYSIYMLTLLALTVVLGIFMYIDTGSGGIINNAIKHVICGGFGIMGYFVPVGVGALFVYLGLHKDIGRMWQKAVLGLLAIVDISAIIGLRRGFTAADALYEGANNGHGGGCIGAAVGNFFNAMVQNVLSYIIFSIAIVVLAGFITNIPLWSYAIKGIKRVLFGTQDKIADMRENARLRKEEEEERRIIESAFENEAQEQEAAADKAEAEQPDSEQGLKQERLVSKQDFSDIPVLSGGAQTKGGAKSEKSEKSERKRLKYVKPEDEESAETRAQEEEEQKKAASSNGIDEVFASMGADEPAVNKTDEDELDIPNFSASEPMPLYDEAGNMVGSFKASEQAGEKKLKPSDEIEEFMNGELESRRNKKITEEEKLNFADELDSAFEKEKIEYVFPDIELLNEPKSESADMRSELRKTAERLINILESFNVGAKLLQVTQGPTVTRYEIQPDTGVKLSKIVNLANDIAMNLAVPTVLVAPVPGKAAVGIEIPNRKVTSVSIREMLESPEFTNAASSLTVALGKDIGGNVVVGNIAKWPHMLIAGATGSGKSVCINTIITSLLYKASPDDVRLIMVDPKVVELGVYNGIPHLLIPVVTDPKKAAGALNWAVAEMMRRYDLFKETNVRKLESYNKLMEKTGGEKIPQLVIIIDELADLMMVAAKEVEDYICRLAQLARAAGIHLIIATQRPSVDVITGLIKANIPSRIAFAVSSQVDSRTILDKAGADKLLGMGDMLYSPTGSRSPMRVQGAFVDDSEIERIIDFIKGSIGETHYSEDLADEIERCATGENGVTPDEEEDGDELLPEAIKLAVELGKISTSMVQRRLSVGYSRAGRIIDQMEARGIISGANGSKPRDVLVSRAEMYTANTSAAESGFMADEDEYEEE